MEEQFHAGELKPLAQLERLMAQGRYAARGLWDGDALIAYALFGIAGDGRTMLLDYFAVLPQYQDAGWGSRFLSALRAEGGGAILLEVEDPRRAPDAAEAETCRRRIRFYERNGCRHTPVELNLFGFDYVIMALERGEPIADADVRRALEDVYRDFFSPAARRAHVRFANSRRRMQPQRLRTELLTRAGSTCGSTGRWRCDGAGSVRAGCGGRIPVRRGGRFRGADMTWQFGARRVQAFGSGAATVWMVADFEFAAQVSAQLPMGTAVIAAVEGVDWDRELTPWSAPPVVRGRTGFGGGADALLRELAQTAIPAVEAELRTEARGLRLFAGGLFALYAALSASLFTRAASVIGVDVVSRFCGLGVEIVGGAGARVLLRR